MVMNKIKKKQKQQPNISAHICPYQGQQKRQDKHVNNEKLKLALIPHLAHNSLFVSLTLHISTSVCSRHLGAVSTKSGSPIAFLASIFLFSSLLKSLFVEIFQCCYCPFL